MKKEPKTIYTCPVCKEGLTKTSRQYICENNHQFDIAREGYINLLLANQKKSKDPGDSKTMINARRDFLHRGYYDNLLQEIITSIEEFQIMAPTIMDIGCGEGYFISKIYKKLQKKHFRPLCFASDISKAAIRSAAKSDKDIYFAVASSFNLPVTSESFNFIIRIFAPSDDNEIVRMLKSDGVLLAVTPGPNHLDKLRDIVYKTPRLHEERSKVITGMRKIHQKQIRYSINIDNKTDLRNLLTMTPYYWNGDNDTKKKFNALKELTTNVDFIITLYKRSTS